MTAKTPAKPKKTSVKSKKKGPLTGYSRRLAGHEPGTFEWQLGRTLLGKGVAEQAKITDPVIEKILANIALMGAKTKRIVDAGMTESRWYQLEEEFPLLKKAAESAANYFKGVIEDTFWARGVRGFDFQGIQNGVATEAVTRYSDSALLNLGKIEIEALRDAKANVNVDVTPSITVIYSDDTSKRNDLLDANPEKVSLPAPQGDALPPPRDASINTQPQSASLRKSASSTPQDRGTKNT